MMSRNIFVDFVWCLDRIFNNNFEKLVTKSNVIETLSKIKYIELFSSVKLYLTLKLVNNLFINNNLFIFYTFLLVLLLKMFYTEVHITVNKFLIFNY